MTIESTIQERFLISGASGLIGAALVRNWQSKPIQITRLVRGNITKPCDYRWNPSQSPAISGLSELNGIRAAVHLSGASVAGSRWTDAYKQEIVTSRVQSTQAIANILADLRPLPEVLVCASAIGIYGDRADEILTEDSRPGEGFLAETCVAWEAATKVAEAAGIRVIHARFGVVLSRGGGALAKMLPLFKLGLGGNLGTGHAWMPWVTLRDVVGIVQYCIENASVQGAMNIVAPEPVRNVDFTRALGRALHRPAIFPAPAFALRAAFGEMADEALLASARVIPDRLVRANYQFADPEINAALKNLLA